MLDTLTNSVQTEGSKRGVLIAANDKQKACVKFHKRINKEWVKCKLFTFYPESGWDNGVITKEFHKKQLYAPSVKPYELKYS